MPDEKKEVSNIPSALRRPVFVSSPTQQPQVQQQVRPPQPVMQPQQRPQPVASTGGGSMVPTAIAVIAIIIALLSLLMAGYSTLTLLSVKGQVKGVADDLKKISATETSISTPLQGSVQISKEIDAGDALPESISFPVNFTLSIHDTAQIVIPGQGVRDIPIDKDIPVNEVVSVNLAQAGKGQKISISTTIPIDSTVSTKVSGNDIWKDQLTDVINRLQSIGG